MDIASDLDPLETAEWRDALDSVLAFEGPERTRFILSQLTEEAHHRGSVDLQAAFIHSYFANFPNKSSIKLNFHLGSSHHRFEPAWGFARSPPLDDPSDGLQETLDARVPFGPLGSLKPPYCGDAARLRKVL